MAYMRHTAPNISQGRNFNLTPSKSAQRHQNETEVMPLFVHIQFPEKVWIGIPSSLNFPTSSRSWK